MHCHVLLLGSLTRFYHTIPVIPAWNSPRRTMAHIWLMNRHSFSLTLWGSQYILCSATVKARACQVSPVPSPSKGADCHQDGYISHLQGSLPTLLQHLSLALLRGRLALRAGRRQGKAGSNSWILISGAASKDRVTPGGIPTEGSSCSFTSGLSLPINAFSGPAAPTTPKASSLQSLLCIVFKYVLSP